MGNGDITGGYLLRMVGFIGMAVGLAWALQVLGFADHTTAFDKMVWIMAAASISGASAGLVMISGTLDEDDTLERNVEPSFVKVRA